MSLEVFHLSIYLELVIIRFPTWGLTINLAISLGGLNQIPGSYMRENGETVRDLFNKIVSCESR